MMSWFSIIKRVNDFEFFLVEVFGVPREAARKLSPSQSLKQAVSQGKLTEYITEEQFVRLLDFAEATQYDRLLEELEKINLEYANERQGLINQRRKERYANDPEYRARRNERTKQRKSTPEYKEKRNQKQRERYANDPEYRRRERERKNRYRREKYANDPEYRRKQNEKRNARRRKNKEEL